MKLIWRILVFILVIIANLVIAFQDLELFRIIGLFQIIFYGFFYYVWGIKE